MHKMKLAALLLIGACASSGGEEDEQAQQAPQACTMIGCNNGLAVEVNSSMQQTVTVNVQAGTEVIHTFRCEPGQPCRAFIDNQTPEQVTVHVQSAAGTVSKTYRPEYKMNRPNGPDCPPECRQATVVVNVS